MKKIQIAIPHALLREFCDRWKVTELSLFGSVLREDFNKDSDVDILVSFSEGAHWTLFDMVHMQDELEAILGRKVDLVSRRGLETSKNQFRKKTIIDSREVIHAS
jgi:predicted nucleotidyltransferase